MKVVAKKNWKTKIAKKLTYKCELVWIAHIWDIPKIWFNDGWWASELEMTEVMAKAQSKGNGIGDHVGKGCHVDKLLYKILWC